MNTPAIRTASRPTARPAPLPAGPSINPARTIHLGHRGGPLRHILIRLGVGEYRRRPTSSAEANLLPPGWYVTPEELERIDAERAKHKRPSATREHRAEYQRTAREKQRRARSEQAPLLQRLVEKWRNECATPAPGRESPEDCWRWLLTAYGMPLGTPMPEETPPPAIVLRAEDFMRSLDFTGEASLLRPGSARTQP